MTYTKTPIFCDNCSTLAVANLDGYVLCTGCLLRIISGQNGPKLLPKITPLAINTNEHLPIPMAG